MISAKSARETSLSVRAKLRKEERDAIERSILMATTRGETQTIVCTAQAISEETFKELRSLGYEITATVDPRDDSRTYDIRWS